MPELPEVETMVRGVRPHVVGRTIIALRRPRGGVNAAGEPLKPIALAPGLSAMAARVRGTLIEAVERRAKRVVLRLSGGRALAVEPRMTGLMLLGEPPTTDHVRLEWTLGPAVDGGAGYPALRFWDRRGLGTVTLYEPGELEQRLGPHKLGPDPLALSPEEWAATLAAGLARTARPVKVALLDQKIAAGVGNLYASEALFHARLAPDRPGNALGEEEVRALAAAARAVLTEAIEYEGSTLSDGTYRNALGDPGRYRNEHRVYQRAGAPCPRCGTEILRTVQAQRSTFHCPTCQR
ncbi:bifunctional DNA-formamidopyrimidine glycosylase/DNA-(apurinic or apyrimidinic site) lyase [Alienimonas californiensis]|uniref:Formamidopyrimidine-DNA glycosylase n=1 Tax=Alienimonas californiensis TaxID=2527989 RepID=A0A517P3K0_9PLAN|nr:bifunctional DNA-formamidopyrimidine glycosylase/DNA-(apurinic or apyrimidinic site) lyase [Alienimonas californiensis]QDT13944.1 Formamidopyrimidine-DNA glycosylase [Alienimonas californiensis]